MKQSSCRAFGRRFLAYGSACGLFAFFAGLPLANPADEGTLIGVGPNVQVSSDLSTQPQFELQAIADPENPNNLLTCVTVMAKALEPADRGFFMELYHSLDGGMTWHAVKKINGTDPSCAFGPSGRAYAFGNKGSGTAVYYSTNGGQNWSPGARVYNSDLDRQFLTVDIQSAHRKGYLYLNAFRGLESYEDAYLPEAAYTVYASADGGRSFHEPVLRFPGPDNQTNVMGPGIVFRDGTYAFIFTELGKIESRGSGPRAWIKVATSNDGGRTFGKAFLVAIQHRGFGADSGDAPYVPEPENGETTDSPVLAVDSTRGPFANRLYAGWADSTTGRAQVFLSHSDNKGKTWSSPVAVDDDASRIDPRNGPDDSQVTIGVNKNGILGVAWNDRRDNPDDLGYYVRFAESSDGGVSFSPSVRVSTAPNLASSKGVFHVSAAPEGFDVAGNLLNRERSPNAATIGLYSRFAFIGGDTSGFAVSSDGAFHPVWIDNRTGYPQVWTAAITVNAVALRYGSAELAGLKDISARTRIAFDNAVLDQQSKTVTLDMYVANRSKKPINGPVWVRFTELRSGLGVIASAQANGSSIREGSALRVPLAESSSSLVPGALSAPIHVIVQVDGPFRFRSPGMRGNALVNMLDIQGQTFAPK